MQSAATGYYTLYDLSCTGMERLTYAADTDPPSSTDGEVAELARRVPAGQHDVLLPPGLGAACSEGMWVRIVRSVTDL
jgi:hypothetical protein